MKRLCIALAFLILACRSEEKVTSTDTISTSGTETTGTASKTSTGASGGTISSLNAEDKQFFISAAQTNLAEINLGQLASDKATSSDVKGFANTMVKVHSAANEELKRLAIRKGVALPAVVTKDQAAATNDLSNRVGKDFDRTYMDEMIKDHENAVGSFQKASTETKDPDLKAWAMNTLPTLTKHLAMAKGIESKLK